MEFLESDGYTFVYLMRNTRNGYTKIGLSKHPNYREKQLQSQEPEVELVDCVMAHRCWEKELHWRYSNARVRGEWFSLSEEQVNQTRALFENKRKWNQQVGAVLNKGI